MRRLTALLAALLLLAFTGCAANPAQPESTSSPAQADETQADFQVESAYPLEYAKEFTVDECTGGTRLITIQNARYLVVPENSTVPNGLSEDITVLQKPLENVYLVSTSAMDPVLKIDALSAVTLSGTSAENWYLPEAKEAMENGEISYAGKYSAPDYERIVSANCGLAIENTMIYHTPEVKEQLEKFGIPVLVERSSYESDPLARMEWVKLYGILFDKEAEAETFFNEQVQRIRPLLGQDTTGKTAAFFSVTSNNLVTVRKSNDYVAKMIGMAGGEYVFSDLSDNGNNLATINLSLEEFYAGAKDADVLIYNSTIEGKIETTEQLLSKCPMLADFKAVQNGNVWCTTQSLFQESMELPDLILDMNRVFAAESPNAVNEDELKFLTHVS
ncbi:ABC transporter substrate-binding protein [Hominenteromicrobium sp.]|uniref:ABC transporter substrate-binding protein n=1 Tax=Hominenteromicrobium sp. TaxID=3073581 RepID=UPI003A8E9984